MPAQCADWPQVKATAIATGSLKQAATAHGISYGAVRVKSHREQWPVGLRIHKIAKASQKAAHAAIIQCSNGAVTAVTSASEALEKTLDEGSKETRIGLTAYTVRMAKQAAKAGVLEEAPLYKAVADIHGKMHPEAQSEQSLSLAFFTITQERRDSGPVVDV